jgi:hypothetical protein
MSLENTLREMLSEGSEIKPSPKQTPESKQRALIKSTLHAEGKPNPTPSASGPGVDYTPKKSIREFYKARLEGALLGESPISAMSGLLFGTGSLGSAAHAVARHMAPASSSPASSSPASSTSTSSAPYQSDDMESRRTQPGYGTNLPAKSQAPLQLPRSYKSRIMGGLLALGRIAQRRASALLSEGPGRLPPGAAHEMPALWGARREALGASVLGIAASGKVFPHPDVTTHNARVAAGHVLQSDDVSSKKAMNTAKPLKAYRKLQRTAMERGLKEALLSEMPQTILRQLQTAGAEAVLKDFVGSSAIPRKQRAKWARQQARLHDVIDLEQRSPELYDTGGRIVNPDGSLGPPRRNDPAKVGINIASDSGRGGWMGRSR